MGPKHMSYLVNRLMSSVSFVRYGVLFGVLSSGCQSISVVDDSRYLGVIKSMQLECKSYAKLPVIDVFADLYRRSNQKLNESGHMSIGLRVINMNENLYIEKLEVPTLAVYDSFLYVARVIGGRVRFENGCICVDCDNSMAVRLLSTTPKDVSSHSAAQRIPSTTNTTPTARRSR